MIEEIMPGNKTRLRIINAVYENPGINLSSLIKRVRASPNLVLKYINKLSAYGIVKEERIGGRKKIHVRNLRANFDNETSRIVYSLVEISKKDVFFKKYKSLRPYFPQLGDILENKQAFILVYGSYARFAATKDSDLDILIAGKAGKEETNRIREVFVALEPELSLKIETISSFLKNKNKPLYQNLLKSHVIVHGFISFAEVLGKIYG